jgi:hypothetical protein
MAAVNPTKRAGQKEIYAVSVGTVKYHTHFTRLINLNGQKLYELLDP